MICESFDIVVVPFPFSDLPQTKRRKALVLSNVEFNRKNKSTILSMITSAAHSSWHLDVPITQLKGTGLNKECLIRAKIFTLDNGLIIEKCGRLNPSDVKNVKLSLAKALPLL
jgi:mRNA interferase MazF